MQLTHNINVCDATGRVALFVGGGAHVGAAILIRLQFFDDQSAVFENQVAPIDRQKSIACNTRHSEQTHPLICILHTRAR